MKESYFLAHTYNVELKDYMYFFLIKYRSTEYNMLNPTHRDKMKMIVEKNYIEDKNDDTKENSKNIEEEFGEKKGTEGFAFLHANGILWILIIRKFY